MIVLSNTTTQTLAPGQSLTFNDTVLHSGCGECHRANTGSVKLRANGIYEASFSGNVQGVGTVTTPVQLVLTVGGEALPETTMITVPNTAGYQNISTTTAIKNCCGDYDRLSVTNNGTASIVIAANPVLFVRRVA